MTIPISTAQMRAIERAAIASGEVSGLELMELAGRGVVDATLEEWPALADGTLPVVVLCGPGNNGGDGFVVARLFAEQGLHVVVFLYGDPEKLPPDAHASYDRWRAMGPVAPFPPQSYAPTLEIYRPGAIFVDALFGIGLTRPLDFELFTAVVGLVENTFAYEWRIVAVDIPSGLDADNGELLCDPPPHPGVAAAADLTVTFHAPKTGQVTGAGPEVCGKLVVKDIGLSRWADTSA
ncbi:NAD(P)H-hydrate epimerase [Pseudoruegeria sp. HB172150]|uniref:NAD(P)H-hydrate epimerase n=1 Tax=Pseudoruegeria sp. HB172150 TaxID=2721164 RepID=UPI00155583C7|nr:NAD(P)H-hydrate epimerase [Pseudoruegeria sp. HB172150]